VLKDGTLQGTWEIREVNIDQLVARMVGREQIHERVPHKAAEHGEPKLDVRDVRDRKLKNVSFQAYAGEILGLAGLAGAGRTELALAIFGAREAESREILVDGHVVEIRSPVDAMAAGIGYLPEDRKEQGLFLEMNVAENIAAARLDAFGGWQVRDAKVTTTAQQFMQKIRIAAASARTRVVQLSGGNQQKVLLSRWLLREPGILIVDEPTRGIDVGAKAEIYKILRELADRGKAIIAISSDLPEVLAICDRILVMREGQITCELPGWIATEEMIMHYAATSYQEQSGP
jgi:ABC-type sugar transport system ATPase subunit